MKLILLTLSLLVMAACRSTPPTDPTAKPVAATPPGQFTIPADSPKLAQIRTELVVASPVPVGNVSAPGKVEANSNRTSHVVLPLTGHVTTVLVKTGDFVRQGQPLLTVESADNTWDLQ